MRKIAVIFTFICLSTYHVSCDGDLTGVEDVDVLTNVDLTITETSVFTDKLEARGIAANHGGNITPPWYIEADFYSDDSFTLKLGGTNERMTYALGNGESTIWVLVFSSDKYKESEYNEFAIKNLRAYKNKD
ncbi:hypothetical protein JW835_03405 [bacterium]|nr:hypothetical protein [bacterium]